MKKFTSNLALLCLAACLMAPLSVQGQSRGFGRRLPEARRVTRAIEFPDTPDHRVLEADFHMHTVFSDGNVWPDIRVLEALYDDLDAIALTDHLDVHPRQEDVRYSNLNRSYEIARKATEGRGSDLVVINGAEVSRLPPGHANAIFLDDANTILRDGPVETYRAARKQGAFIFFNHPWLGPRTAIPKVTDLHRRLMREGLIQGIEVANAQGYSEKAFQIALDHDLTLIGNSDVHGIIDWQYDVAEGGHRPVTLVLAEERSKVGLKEALRAGRTAVWFKNTLVGREEHVKPVIKASLSTQAKYVEGKPRYFRSSVVEVVIENTSSTEYLLENLSDYAFFTRSDRVRLKPRDQTRLAVKVPEKKSSVELTFKVLNAVVAPEEHPTISLHMQVE